MAPSQRAPECVYQEQDRKVGNSSFHSMGWGRQKRGTKAVFLFLNETGLGEELKH